MEIVDFHNHLMPGVDDGAQTVAEAETAIDAFVQDGVSVIVATPHVNASITRRPADLAERMEELDRAFEALQSCAQGKPVRLERGVELLLDIPNPDLSDARLRLAGGRFLLMEFPGMMVPPQSPVVLRAIADSGVTPIVAHPERYYGMLGTLELARAWRAAGAYLQVNGGSLLGRYGVEARKVALELAQRGWVDYLCSDYHTRGATHIVQYARFLESVGGREQAATLMQTNPSRMLEGNLPLPVQPLRLRASLWSRVAAVFKS